MTSDDIAERVGVSVNGAATASWRAIRDSAGAFALASFTAFSAFCWFYPIAGAFLASVQTSAGGWSLHGYFEALQSPGWGTWYLNSVATSGGVTLIVLTVGAMTGYAISQLQFPGRKLIWLAVLASFFVPIQALIISHFVLMYQFKLLNSWLGVMLPQTIAPLAIIVYKQFFDRVPYELREAALLDGAAEFTMLRKVYLPMTSGVTAGLGIITFIGAWNTFLWPFLAVTREEKMNISVALDQVGGPWLAGAFLAGLPVLIVYLCLHKRIMAAVSLTGSIKG